MGHYFTNEKLPSEVKTTKCVVFGKSFTFFTDNGVFSKDGLDFGSRLLLESIPLEDVGAKVLDVGCGYGVIGIILNKLISASVDMVDVNLRALHLSERNIKANKCGSNIHSFESNCYVNINDKYDTIITNPPIRAGKKVVCEILLNAKNYLRPSGTLFLVIRKEQGAKSLITILQKEYDVKVLNKKKGFFVLKCTI